MKHFKYLKYLVRHKWFVMLACFRMRLYWRGIVHDWSKLLPCEWFPYVEFFYGYKPTEEEFRRARIIGIYLKSPEHNRARFDEAWLHHQHLNPHHWQHWVLREDSGAVKILEMPARCVKEMVCDWEGAGRAITGKNDLVPWYTKNREIIQLAPFTRALVDELILGCKIWK